MAIGYVKLHRRFADHPIWKDSFAAHFYMHCKMNARRKPSTVARTIGKARRVLNLDRGQLLAGRDWLAESLGMVPSTVRNVMQRCEHKYQVISTKQDNGVTVITDLFYDWIESDDEDVGQQSNSRRTVEGQLEDIPEKVGKIEEEGEGRLLVEKSTRARKPRKPDPVWDRVVDRWFGGKSPEPSRKRIGKVVRDFKSLGATPDEIDRRCENYRANWPRLEEPSPEAIVKHWHAHAHRNGEESGLAECGPVSVDDPRLEGI